MAAVPCAELLALALTHIGGDQHAPICNLLVGAEETGRGVPLAARGCHFAVDTALGRKVTPGTLIDGFRPDTRFVTIRLRSNGCNIKPIELIVKTGDRFRVAAIDYHGGLRYPHLVRDESVPARLDDILAPRP